MMGYAAVSGLLLGATIAYLTALPRGGLVRLPEKILAILLASVGALRRSPTYRRLPSSCWISR